MKLCIIAPSFSGGGAEKVAVNLANQYADGGIDVSLLVFVNAGPFKEELSPAVRLVDLGVTRSRYAFFKLRGALAAISPTHVLSVIRDVNVILGLVAPGSAKYTITYREANTLHALRAMPLYKRFLYKILMTHAYRRADCIIANSNDTREDLVKSGIVEGSKVVVVGNPVIPRNFESRLQEKVGHRWIEGGYRILLNVGRLHPQKNQGLLIQAFSSVLNTHPDVKLLIIGEGPEKAALVEKIALLGIQDSVEILPFQKNPFPYYKASALFVLTSDWEGFGNILVESLACGTPVVSTNCPGGPAHILADGTYGALVPCGDPDRLATVINEQLDQPAFWDPDFLRSRGNEYTVQAVSSEYLFHIRQDGN